VGLVDSSGIEIRPYRSDDAGGTLDVFLAAVTETAAADYSPEQIKAWSGPEERNEPEWHRARSDRNTYVAVVGDEIAGFSDVSDGGYIDMMFVSPRHARQGVAKALVALLSKLAQEGGARSLTAGVSITARPFFESQGFVVQAEQHPIIGGVQMTNFRMSKKLR
jgi:putative acetyltransferase